MLILNYLNRANLKPKVETSWKSRQFANWYLSKIKNLQPTQVKIIDVAFKALSLVVSCLPALGTSFLLLSYDISIGSIINLKRAKTTLKPINIEIKSTIVTTTIAIGVLGAYFYSGKISVPSFSASKSVRSFGTINSLIDPYRINAKIALKAYYALGSFAVSGASSFIKNALCNYEKATLSNIRGHIKLALMPWIVVLNLLSIEEHNKVIDKINSSFIGSTINKIGVYAFSFLKGGGS